MALTSKQEAFVAAYISSFNATQAALDAGYSEKTARSIGSENLTKPDIQRAIEDYLNEYAMSAGEVLYHLTNIARGDIGEAIDSAGYPDIHNARQKGMTRLIKKIKTRTITTEQSEVHETEIEMYDRLKALDLLAKYHDLTNKVRVEDWRSQAIDDIKRGDIEYEALVEAFDVDIATELFRAAGVPIQISESAE